MKVPSTILLLFLLMPLHYLKASELTVVSENYPPFITNENNKISGTVTEVVRRILTIGQIKYTLAIYPWARSYKMATSQKNILIYSITKTEERTPYFHWFCPIYQSSAIYAYKRADNPVAIDSLQQLKSTKIGVLRHDHSHEHFINKGFEVGVNLDISATENTNIKKLVKGRIDVIVQSKEAMMYRLNKLSLGHIQLIKGLAIYNDKPLNHCMALSLGSDPILIDKMHNAVKQWRQQQKTSQSTTSKKSY